MTDEKIIEAKQLSKVYQSEDVATTVLKEASFAMGTNEFIAIMGPSGSGKSTLLHIIGLLDRPSSGKYLFGGHDTARLSDDELAHIRNTKIGFVFQAFHLLARTSVLKNVMLPLQYSESKRSEHEKRARAALDKVDMLHRLDHSPSQLSGGEKQRVCIARALVAEPDILLADEPTGNLDSKTGANVMQLIDDLHGKGLAVILITHETPTAGYAERIIRLKDGAIESDEKTQKRHDHYTK